MSVRALFARQAGRRSANGIVLASAVLGSLVLLAAAVALVLWPRWPQRAAPPDAPSLPISVGGVLFNVPPAAIRVKLQRRAGAQDRLDLAFLWPALVPPDPAAKPSVSEEAPILDRLFVTIAALDGGLDPNERIKTIYPRYFDFGRFAGPDGLLVIRFRDGTPYRTEDLFYDPAAPDRFAVRCTRPGAGPTPGTCLWERRMGGAAGAGGAVDVTVRFPRDWLGDWRRLFADVDRLIASLQAPHS